MSVVRNFQGLSNVFETERVTALTAFNNPDRNVAILNLPPQPIVQVYTGGLDLMTLPRQAKFYNMGASYSLSAGLAAGADPDDVRKAFSHMPEGRGRDAFMEDVAFKADVANALMNQPNMMVSLTVKGPATAGQLHRDPGPGARFISNWHTKASAGHTTGFVADALDLQPLQPGWNAYGELTSPAIAPHVRYPQVDSLYGFKSKDFGAGSTAAMHVEPYLETIDDTRFYLYMHPPVRQGQTYTDIQKFNPEATAKRLEAVEKRWAHRLAPTL